MTYTPPSQLAFRTLVTPDVWNQQVADNISHLHDQYKSQWFPVTAVSGTATFATLNTAWPTVLIDANAEGASTSIAVPSTFNNLVSLLYILRAGATATLNYDLRIEYSAVGELINTHTASTLGGTLAMVINTMYAIDFTSLASALAANDFMGANLENNGVNAASVLGVLMYYQSL